MKNLYIPSKSIFGFGGPNNFKTQPYIAKKIIDKIISDENYIHSCYDYDGHLEFVREAAFRSNKPLKLILKCYLNYPELESIRRRSLYFQIKRFKEFFKNIKIDLIPQISSINSFSNNGLYEFLKIIHNEFSINMILLESFPSKEDVIREFIIQLNKHIISLGLESQFRLGLTFYENIFTIGLTADMVEFVSDNNLYYVPMRVLGSNKSKSNILISKEKIKNDSNYENFFCAITRVSSITQYYDLMNFSDKNISKIRNSKKLTLFRDQSINSKIAIGPYSFNQKRNLFHKIKSFKIYISDLVRVLKKCIFKRGKISLIKILFDQNFL